MEIRELGAVVINDRLDPSGSRPGVAKEFLDTNPHCVTWSQGRLVEEFERGHSTVSFDDDLVSILVGDDDHLGGVQPAFFDDRSS